MSNQLIYRIILISFIFSINFKFNNLMATYKPLFVPDIPNEIFIKLKKKDLGIYSQKIYDIKNDKIDIILPKYKTYIDAKIFFLSKGNYKSHDAKLRIVGDWEDHTNINDMISSFQIKIKDGNIGGIRKFRLYLQETKKDAVLWSVIHETYGFPTLFHKEVTVNFNNKRYLALFEETPQKEFLERWSIRESPIVEYDERQWWSNRYTGSSKNSASLKVIGNNFKIDNSDFIKNGLGNIITLNALNIKGNLINTKFEKLNKIHGAHGLVFHNRKFIYDPIYNLHIPIVYDSMLDVTSCTNNHASAWKSTSNKNKKYYKEIIQKYNSRIIKKNKYLSCFVKNILIKNEINFKNLVLTENINAIKNLNLIKYRTDNDIFVQHAEFLRKKMEAPRELLKVYGYSEINNKFCISNTQITEDTLKNFYNCKALDFTETKLLLSGKLDNGKEIFPRNIGYIDKKNDLEYELKEILLTKDLTIKIKKNTTLYLKIKNNNLKNKKINVELNGAQKSKLIIFNSDLENIDIYLESIESKKLTESPKYDKNLITGCLTILDSKMNNVKLFSKGTSCEDDINLIRVEGNIDYIQIENSQFDAIDLDFSNIKIQKVNIKNAGNDCIDLSYGNYKILDAILNNCSDKGISVGEKSIFVGENINVTNSKTALANKDDSTSYIKKISSENNRNCILNYNKKTEFGLGSVFLVDDKCHNGNLKNMSLITNKVFDEQNNFNE